MCPCKIDHIPMCPWHILCGLRLCTSFSWTRRWVLNKCASNWPWCLLLSSWWKFLLFLPFITVSPPTPLALITGDMGTILTFLSPAPLLLSHLPYPDKASKFCPFFFTYLIIWIRSLPSIPAVTLAEAIVISHLYFCLSCAHLGQISCLMFF